MNKLTDAFTSIHLGSIYHLDALISLSLIFNGSVHSEIPVLLFFSLKNGESSLDLGVTVGQQLYVLYLFLSYDSQMESPLLL